MSTPNGQTAPPARRGTGRGAIRSRALRGVSAPRSSATGDNTTNNAKQGLARAGLFGARGGRGRRGHGGSHTPQPNAQAFQSSKPDGNRSSASPFRGLDGKSAGPGRTLKSGQTTSNRLRPGATQDQGVAQQNGVLSSKPPQFGSPYPSPFGGNGSGASIDRSRDPRRRNTSSPFPQKARATASDDYNGRYEQLKLDRANRRTEAIRAGQMADPNQPISLNRAITPTGTCTDMCPEYERVERIVQKMVDKSEKFVDPESGAQTTMEAMMIKRFRRSAAGYDEQLPSDIRTPKTLLQTLNYMLRHVLQDDSSLGSVHKFVWDRTRSIRNDLSIQQLTQEDDVKVAVKCLERIARFHIVSLHLLSSPDNSEPFDHHQDREQLNNTLLSLLYYYDDNRVRIRFPNEDEFRAYYIVYSIRDQRPDLESRVQKWPRELREAPRVRVALELFAAATNTWEYQGALDARRPNAIAQGFYARFFHIIKSDSVSYLMGCIAEIYFNHIRQTAIRSIWKAYCRHPVSQQSKNQEWTVDELTSALAFDDNDQTIAFCEEQDLQLATNAAGETYLNWAERSLDSVAFSPSTQQTYSATYVETKRCGRNLAALILGMTVSQAARHRMIDETLLQDDYGSQEMEDQVAEEPLFVSDDESKERPNGAAHETPQPNPSNNVPAPSIFSFSQSTGGQTLFGQPSKSEISGNAAENTNMAKPKASESPFKFSATAPAFSPQGQPSGEFGPQPQNLTPSPFSIQPLASTASPSPPTAASAPPSSTPATFSSTFGSTFAPGFGAKFGAQSGDQKAPEPPKAPLFGPVDASDSVKFGKPNLTDKAAATPSPFQPLPSISAPASTPSGTTTSSAPPKPAFSFSKPEEKPSGLASGFGKPSFGESSFKPSSSSPPGKQPSIFDQGASSPFKSGLFSQSKTKESSPAFGQPSVAKPSFTFDTAVSRSTEDQPKGKPTFGAPSTSASLFTTLAPNTADKGSPTSGLAPKQAEVEDSKRQEELKAAEAKKKADEAAKRAALEKEAAEREASERETAAKEAERREEERKEALAREAAKREAEKQESERREALAREAAKKKLEEKRAAERAAARAKMEVEELKAAQADIARIQAAEKEAERRELEKREAILQDMAKRKAALYEDGDSSAERYKPRRKSEEDLLAVEELLRLDRFKPQSPPSKPLPSTDSLINEDELLFSAARMAANTLANGKRLFSDVSDFRDSYSYSASPSPHTDRFSRSMPTSGTPRSKGKAPASHITVNGYDVALAPETPLGLGRTLSRTEQRIRQTGARGLASLPLPSLGKTSAGSKPRKTKRVKRDESSA